MRISRKLDMSDRMTRSILLLIFCCFRLCVFVRQQIVNTEIEVLCVYTFGACVYLMFISPAEEKKIGMSVKVTRLRYSGQTAFPCHILPAFLFPFEKKKIGSDTGSDELISQEL